MHVVTKLGTVLGDTVGVALNVNALQIICQRGLQFTFQCIALCGQLYVDNSCSKNCRMRYATFIGGVRMKSPLPPQGVAINQ